MRTPATTGTGLILENITIETCDNKEEFKELLKKTIDFYKFKSETFKGIDLMCDETIKKDFNKLGLDKNYYLYKSYCKD